MSSAPETPFPAGVSIHPSLQLVTWHPHGVLDAALMREILAFVEHEEGTTAEPFHRFTDLSGLDAVRLSFAEVEEIALKRIASYHGAPVKTAILALNPLAFGMARMYEQLMRRSPIEVCVFHQLTSAAEWLDMPIEVLASRA